MFTLIAATWEDIPLQVDAYEITSSCTLKAQLKYQSTQETAVMKCSNLPSSWTRTLKLRMSTYGLMWTVVIKVISCSQMKTLSSRSLRQMIKKDTEEDNGDEEIKDAPCSEDVKGMLDRCPFWYDRQDECTATSHLLLK